MLLYEVEREVKWTLDKVMEVGYMFAEVITEVYGVVNEVKSEKVTRFLRDETSSDRVRGG